MARHTSFLVLAALALGSGLTAARAAETGLEYRLKVKDGVPFAFDHAEEEFFSPTPFMTAKDFARAVAKKSTNSNTPGDWEVVLTHTAIGRAKIRAVADADRSREFCLVFHARLYFCEAFPPVMKGVYDKDRTITGRFTKAMAEKLAGEMAAEIRRAHTQVTMASDRASRRAVRTGAWPGRPPGVPPATAQSLRLRPRISRRRHGCPTTHFAANEATLTAAETKALDEAMKKTKGCGGM